jgi:hypothetical protein
VILESTSDQSILKNSVLCISGMHRSGTSLVASWLENCTLSLHDGRVWGPFDGNPLGHFEDIDFHSLHSGSIIERAPKSFGWIYFPQQPLSFSAKYLQCAQDLVDKRNHKYARWGWKDPRSVLFLNQWKQLVPDLKVLMIWRPCSSVVDSLVRRAKNSKKADLKISFFQAIRLWIRYNQLLCAYKKEHPDDTLLFDIQTITNSDATVFNLVNEQFSLDLTYSPIENVYNPILLKEHRNTLNTRLISAIRQVASVEYDLNQLSDFVYHKQRTDE